MNSLEAKNLTCGYHQRTVIESLSLAVRSGEVLILLGPNGAGKTTLLRSLARFLRPSAGSVLLDDSDIWSLSADDASQRIALMPQTERRDWPLTVAESVQLGRAPHRGWYMPYTDADRQIVESALEATGLSSLRNRPITELSGGEWRRMIFARALTQQAGILLLDEPTAGLDLKYQHESLRLAANLATSRNMAVVISLHDLNHAALYGHKLALIAEHKLLSVGSAQEVLTEDMIYRAYGVRVTIVPHPVYGKPMVVPLVENHHAPAERATL